MPIRPRSGSAFEMRQRKCDRAPRSRAPERGDTHALRVHTRHHVLDGRVLPGGVHGLEHEEQRVRAARPEKLLCVLQALDPAAEDLLRRRVELLRRKPVELASTGPAGVAPSQIRLRAWLHSQCLQHSISSVHIVSRISIIVHRLRSSLRRCTTVGRFGSGVEDGRVEPPGKAWFSITITRNGWRSPPDFAVRCWFTDDPGSRSPADDVESVR